MNIFVKSAIVTVCLCATVIAGNLKFSIWHIDGHKYQWQQDQLDAGLPIEFSIRVPASHENAINHPSQITTLNAQAPIFTKLNGQSLSLRMNNITNDMDYATPRINPLTEANADQSFLSIRRLADGTLDDTPVPSPWASSDNWAVYGAKMANAVWTKRLQEIVHSPTSVILRENNEGPRHVAQNFYYGERVCYIRLDNNTRQFANVNTPRDKWVDVNRQPMVGDWMPVVVSSENILAYKWKTKDELDAFDIRAEAWVAPKRGTLPTLYDAEFTSLYKTKYDALFAAFQDNLSPSWKAVWQGCCGYGSDQYHHADSPATYTNYYADRPASLCHPQWAVYRDRVVAAQQSKAWREISIRVNGQTIYQSVVDGTGDFVDADSYACFNMHWAWALQAAGKDVRLVWWDNYNTPPTHSLISTTYRDKLIQLGRPDLTVFTIEQGEIAVMRRQDEIPENELLRRYWVEGTTVIVPSTQNTTAITRVYATETTIPGNARKLLAIYTPCTQAQVPQINVGPHSVPWARWAYYRTNPLEPLPDTTSCEYQLELSQALNAAQESKIQLLEEQIQAKDNIIKLQGDVITLAKEQVAHWEDSYKRLLEILEVE